MQHWTIGRKLYSGVGALVALLLAANAVSLFSATSIHGRLEQTGRVTSRMVALTHSISADFEEAYSNAKTMILAGMAGNAAGVGNAKKAAEAAGASIGRTTEELRRLNSSDDGRRALDAVDEGARAWNRFFAAFERHTAAGELAEANDLFDKQAAEREATRQALAALENVHQGILERDMASSEAAYATIQSVIWLGSALSMVVALMVIRTVRGINRSLHHTALKLREGAQMLSSASSQVSTSSQSLSQGATEQASSLEETSASMEEMASMTRKNAENTEAAAALMRDADGMMASSDHALQDMVASMQSIKDASTRVAKIIKTIDEIAFQTNILALNAAVEAARAGQAGMGFAVVADEVRNLAQRSAQAARDTAGLIEESVTKSHDGTSRVESVVTSIRSVTETVARARELVDEVSLASRQQAQGIEQVTQAVAQMEKVTQSTAATAEETAASSDELSAQARTALSLVFSLDRMVGGETAARAAEPAAAPQPDSAPHPPLPRDPAKTPRLVLGTSKRSAPAGTTGTFGPY